MELDLSLGDTPKPGGCMERHGEERAFSKVSGLSVGLSFCQSADSTDAHVEEEEKTQRQNESVRNEKSSVGSPIQLDLLPHAPVLRIDNNHSGHHISLLSSENKEICESFPAGEFSGIAKGVPASIVADEANNGAASSNSAGSSFQLEISMHMDRSKGNNSRRNNCRNKAKLVGEPANVSSKSVERKLRLSKEQSTFLEQSFKEHYTLNPKQKIYLAKQLNLRPRQVEVWFQNRRARTKLKQTELDFQCLKRWCEALKEENRRLERELQELRAAPKSHYFRSLAIGRAATAAVSICPFCRRISEPDQNTNVRMNMSKTMPLLF